MICIASNYFTLVRQLKYYVSLVVYVSFSLLLVFNISQMHNGTYLQILQESISLCNLNGQLVLATTSLCYDKCWLVTWYFVFVVSQVSQIHLKSLSFIILTSVTINFFWPQHSSQNFCKSEKFLKMLLNQSEMSPFHGIKLALDQVRMVMNFDSFNYV